MRMGFVLHAKVLGANEKAPDEVFPLDISQVGGVDLHERLQKASCTVICDGHTICKATGGIPESNIDVNEAGFVQVRDGELESALYVEVARN